MKPKGKSKRKHLSETPCERKTRNIKPHCQNQIQTVYTIYKNTTLLLFYKFTRYL